MDQLTDMEYLEGNMELGSYQESVPVEYADGGTVDWADETIIAGNGLTPSLAHYPQSIFTTPESIVSDHLWSSPHTLSSSNGEAGAQLPQTHYAQPPPYNVSASTTSIFNFQNSVNYPESHHLDH